MIVNVPLPHTTGKTPAIARCVLTSIPDPHYLHQVDRTDRFGQDRWRVNQGSLASPRPSECTQPMCLFQARPRTDAYHHCYYCHYVSPSTHRPAACFHSSNARLCVPDIDALRRRRCRPGRNAHLRRWSHSMVRGAACLFCQCLTSHPLTPIPSECERYRRSYDRLSQRQPGDGQWRRSRSLLPSFARTQFAALAIGLCCVCSCSHR